MAGKRVLVTGATGFIGGALVKALLERGHEVTSLVRESSDTDYLQTLGSRRVVADMETQSERLVAALAGQDQVYHLAASTRAVRSRELLVRNPACVRNLYEACLKQSQPPRVLLVSSLAANGPSQRGLPLDETSPLRPVSHYGRSKQRCEALACEYATRVPTTIVRPPIVFGDRDRDSWQLFRLIAQTGWHLVPTFATNEFSLIHVDDLVQAMIAMADRGERVDFEATPAVGQGVYFAADPQVVTYSEFGRMIGHALGRKRTRVLRIARPCLWAFVMANELKARIRQHPELLNVDKYREGVAGSWACRTGKLAEQLGFTVARPLTERLRQTVHEFRQRGWLPPGRYRPSPNRRPHTLSDAS